MKDIEVLRKEIETKYKDYWVKESIAQPKVSIIVPMYNVEDFIEECLSSLIRQTLKDIEIIVINDGSPDSSVDIARCFDVDSRIKIFEQKNSGLSATRNNGISYVNGEYLCLVRQSLPCPAGKRTAQLFDCSRWIPQTAHRGT